ncbi:MAG: Maf family protein [Methylococcales bacterium]
MNDSTAQLVLASASPRRRELLEQIGLRFVVQPATIDEQIAPGEIPEHGVLRLAAEKSAQVFKATKRDLPVLGADTIVVLGDRILRKPLNQEHGIAMLSQLSGTWHRVLSAVSLRGREHWQAMSESRVWFRPLEPSEMLAYWHSGEAWDKAGAYAIQGLGGVFVRRVEGSYSGVVGLPIYETASLLRKAGISLFAD